MFLMFIQKNMTGGMVVEMAKGMRVEEAGKIIQKDILNTMGGLPKETLHCALLAANTLKGAVKNYTMTKPPEKLRSK